MTNLSITNSPVGPKRYHRSKRLMFLFAALRTRSLLARNELASIALGAQVSSAELCQKIFDNELGKNQISNLVALRDLAWLLSNQKSHESDLANSFAIYRWVVKNFGWRRMPHMHRVAIAITALLLGRPETARAAITSNQFGRRIKWGKLLSGVMPKVASTLRVQQFAEAMNSFFMLGRDYSLPIQFLELDIANPFRTASAHDLGSIIDTENAAQWLGKLNSVLIGKHAAAMQFSPASQADANAAPFERLSAPTSESLSRVTSMARQPLVTIVVSTFEPNQHLKTSVQSALNQTYKNIEVLVVDDASPLGFDAVLGEVSALDQRVKVLRQSKNGGTYRIRNRALDEAAGELITFQDSDDWMHPMRIELQVAALLSDTKAVANISMSTRLTDRLEAVESGRRFRLGICEPALMFWRERVRDRIGYFDTVRKGGDTEYRKRIERAFGIQTPMVLPWRTLTIQRADNGGLTQGELGFRWIAEFRTQYRDSYLHWHSKIGKKFDWRIENTEARAFYAPRLSTMVASEARASQNFNLVIAANLRDPQNAKVAVEKAQAALASGLSVALLQINSMYPLHLSRAISPSVLALLNDNKVQLVQPNFEVQAGKFELIAPNAWLSSYAADRFAWRVGEVWVTAPVEATESFLLEGPNLATELAEQLSGAFGTDALVSA